MPSTGFAAILKYLAIGIVVLIALSVNSSVTADPLPADCTGLCDLAWSPADKQLLGAVDELGMWLYDAAKSDSVPQFFPHDHSVSLSFDPEGNTVAVTSCPDFTVTINSCQGDIALFDLREKTWKSLGEYDYGIENVKFSPDGRYVAFEEHQPQLAGIRLIDLTSNESFLIADRDHNRTSLIIDYAFDPQSTTIAISNGSIAFELDDFLGISVWRLSDQTLLASTTKSLIAANVSFTDDGNILLVQYDTQVSIWNYRTGSLSPLKRLAEIEADNLHRLSFSNPPADLLASLLNNGFPADRTLFAWNIYSGKQIFARTFPKDSFVDLIAMSPNDAYISYSSTVDKSKVVGIWDRSNNLTREVRMIH